MKTLTIILLVPLIVLAFLIAAEQEETTVFESGSTPEYSDHDDAWRAE